MEPVAKPISVNEYYALLRNTLVTSRGRGGGQVVKTVGVSK